MATSSLLNFSKVIDLLLSYCAIFTCNNCQTRGGTLTIIGRDGLYSCVLYNCNSIHVPWSRSQARRCFPERNGTRVKDWSWTANFGCRDRVKSHYVILSYGTYVSYIRKMIGWIRCRLSFALLKASIMSVRGGRSSANWPVNGTLHVPVELQSAEGQLIAVWTLTRYCQMHYTSIQVFFISSFLFFYLLFLNLLYPIHAYKGTFTFREKKSS